MGWPLLVCLWWTLSSGIVTRDDKSVEPDSSLQQAMAWVTNCQTYWISTWSKSNWLQQMPPAVAYGTSHHISQFTQWFAPSLCFWYLQDVHIIISLSHCWQIYWQEIVSINPSLFFLTLMHCHTGCQRSVVWTPRFASVVRGLRLGPYLYPCSSMHFFTHCTDRSQNVNYL